MDKKSNIVGLDNHGDFVREQFTFYRSWYDTISELSSCDKLAVFDAIAQFSIYGKMPEKLTMKARLVLTAFAHTLSKSRVNSRNSSAKTNEVSSGSDQVHSQNFQVSDKNTKETDEKNEKSTKTPILTACKSTLYDQFVFDGGQNEIETNREQDKDKVKDKGIEKDILLEKSKKEKGYKKRKFDASTLEFVAPGMVAIFQEWLDYKQARSESYKTEASLSKCYANLIKLANGDTETAQKIIDQSIGNNWSGIFELKNNNNGRNQQHTNCYSNGNAGKEQRDRDFAVSVMQQLNESKGKDNTVLPF